MSSKLYFAYGSNMDFDQMSSRCPDAQYLGIATLEDYELKMDSAGYATVVKNPGHHVQGALWNLDEADERSLDGYEGVSCGCYCKQDVSVSFIGSNKEEVSDCAYGFEKRSAQGVSLDVLVYLSTRPPFANATFRPDYLEKVRSGAEKLSLDAHTLGQINSFSVTNAPALAA